MCPIVPVLIAALLIGAPPQNPDKGPARVIYVSASLAYINRGATSGINVGDVIAVSQDKQRACNVIAIADTSATCKRGRLRVGDRLDVADATKKTSPKLAKVASLTSADVDAAQLALTRADFEKVAYRGEPAVVRSRLGGTIGAQYMTWAQHGGQSYQVERIDIGFAARNLGEAGIDATVRATAMHWSDRPGSARFRPDSTTQLYVWEASLSRHSAGFGPAFGIGRLRAAYVPGLPLLDGAQLGLTIPAIRGEVGAYGGGVTDPLNYQPRLSVWAAGVYGHGQLSLARNILVSESLRAGVVNLANGQRLVAAGAEVHTFFTSHFQSVGSVHFAGPVDELKRSRLQSWDASATVHAGELDLFASYRDTAHFDELASSAFVLAAPNQRGDAGATYRLKSWLALTARGGGVSYGPAAQREFFGPEARFSEVFPWRASVAAGYLAEIGDIPAHTVYVQADGAPATWLTLRTRVSLSLGVGEARYMRESSLWFTGDLRFGSRVSLRLATFATYGRLINAAGEPPPLGIAGTASLAVAL